MRERGRARKRETPEVAAEPSDEEGIEPLFYAKRERAQWRGGGVWREVREKRRKVACSRMRPGRAGTRPRSV